jgi:hypothetical protein
MCGDKTTWILVSRILGRFELPFFPESSQTRLTLWRNVRFAPQIDQPLDIIAGPAFIAFGGIVAILNIVPLFALSVGQACAANLNQLI